MSARCPPLQCPACAAGLREPDRCAACGRAFPRRQGLPALVLEERVQGPDRWLRWVYDAFGRLHDPLLRHGLAPIDGFDEPALREALLEGFAPDPGGCLLDAGCGTGEELLRLGRRFPQATLVGVDLSTTMLAQAQARLAAAGQAAWLAFADVHHLPFPDGAFAGAVQVGAINNFRDKRAALAELGRVLRPGAPLLLVDEALAPSATRRRDRLIFRALTWYDPAPGDPSAYLPPTLERVRWRQLSRYYYALLARRR